MGHREKEDSHTEGSVGVRPAGERKMEYKVIPISEKIAHDVRRSMISPQFPSLPAFSSVATGYGPCRCCLETFKEGSEFRTSFTYDPVEGILDLPQPGPVFIHTSNCERFAGDSFPNGLRGIPMYLEAFDKGGMLRQRVRIDDGREDEQIRSLFADEAVGLMHIRNAEAGCFIARVEKS